MNATDRIPMVALVGRPNVGKSTLFNRYAGYRRALVADQPGLTRDRIAERIEVANRTIWLVDTAGLDPVKGEGLEANVQAQARAGVEAADVILFVRDGPLYSPATSDFHVAMADMLIGGFQVAGCGMFPPLAAHQVAIGLPASTSAAGSGPTASGPIPDALDCLYPWRSFGVSF